MRKGFIDNGDGTVTVPLENIWARAKRWGTRHGYAWDASYGVVGIAPV